MAAASLVHQPEHAEQESGSPPPIKAFGGDGALGDDGKVPGDGGAEDHGPSVRGRWLKG